MGVVRVGIILGGNCPGGNCLGGNCPGWELSLVGIVRVRIVRVPIVLGGNCPVGIVRVRIVRVRIVLLPFLFKVNDIVVVFSKFKDSLLAYVQFRILMNSELIIWVRSEKFLPDAYKVVSSANNTVDS